MKERIDSMGAVTRFARQFNIDGDAVVQMVTDLDQKGTLDSPIDLGEAGGSFLNQIAVAVVISGRRKEPVVVLIRQQKGHILMSFDAQAGTFSFEDDTHVLIQEVYEEMLSKYGFRQV